ncbi:hypothetical protein HY468_01270 [Candidatus Roizmanbacteria bacterium]|nr:hypothetical protein [Candidatus Roizmanbacteria bacterium]
MSTTITEQMHSKESNIYPPFPLEGQYQPPGEIDPTPFTGIDYAQLRVADRGGMDRRTRSFILGAVVDVDTLMTTIAKIPGNKIFRMLRSEQEVATHYRDFFSTFGSTVQEVQQLFPELAIAVVTPLMGGLPLADRVMKSVRNGNVGYYPVAINGTAGVETGAQQVRGQVHPAIVQRPIAVVLDDVIDSANSNRRVVQLRAGENTGTVAEHIARYNLARGTGRDKKPFTHSDLLPFYETDAHLFEATNTAVMMPYCKNEPFREALLHQAEQSDSPWGLLQRSLVSPEVCLSMREDTWINGGMDGLGAGLLDVGIVGKRMVIALEQRVPQEQLDPFVATLGELDTLVIRLCAINKALYGIEPGGVQKIITAFADQLAENLPQFSPS